MKKKTNALLPAAAILIFLCAAYGILTCSQEKQMADASGSSDAEQIYMTDAGSLSSITMESNGQSLSFQKEGDTWYYKSDKDCPIRQYTVTTLADTLSRLRAERSLENPDKLSAYGLDAPSIRYGIVSGEGGSQTILIGSPVPGTGDTASGYASEAAEYYACLEGSSQVFTVGSYLPETSAKGLYDFVETETLPYVTGSDIKEMAVTKEGKTSRFYKKTIDENNNIAWYSNPEADEASRLPDNAPFNNLAEAISGLSIASCTTYKATDEELGSYGLSTPVMTLSWTYEKGGETDTITLDIGSPDDEGTGYYTRKNSSRAINLISKDSIEKCLNAQYPVPDGQ